MRVLVALLVLAAQPAQALSCLRPELARSYAEAEASEDRFRVALGRLAPPAGWRAPATEDPAARERAGYEVETTGALRFGGRGGFGPARPASVTVRVGCLAHWCGAPPEGEAVLFLREEGGALVLDEGPCPGWSFGARPEVVRAAEACLAGGCPAP